MIFVHLEKKSTNLIYTRIDMVSGILVPWDIYMLV